jgi:AraC family transcriptional regulator
MDLHATNSASRAIGTPVASPQAAASRAPRRLAYEAHFSRDRPHRLHDWSDDAAPDVAMEITPSEAAIRHRLSWHGMGVETARFAERGNIESRSRAAAHLLVLFEEGARKDGYTLVEGLTQSTLRNCRGKLIFVPSGHGYFDRREPCGITRVTYFYFDSATLASHAEAGATQRLFGPRLFFEDSGIRDTAIKLRSLIDNFQKNDRHDNRLYCESLGVVLAYELVRLLQGAPRAEPSVRGGLAPWQQRAVAEYIERHVLAQISFTALAQLARLSPYHFSRAFKQSFGMPPHRFHMHRRIEHAKLLLARPAASVTSVGMNLGFRETSAFTASFRRMTGVTPTDYRRSVL